jgi:hypothetical protein
MSAEANITFWEARVQKCYLGNARPVKLVGLSPFFLKLMYL